MPISEVFNEDNMVGMARFPDKFFDLAIVDLNYGFGEDGRKSKSRAGYVKQKNGTKLYVDSIHKAKDWDNAPPPIEYFEELRRVSKNQIIWGANHFGNMPPSSAWIIWDKCNEGTDQADVELAYTSFKTAARIFRFMWSGMMQGSPEDGTKMQGNKKLNEKRIHPTQKPVKLYRWCLGKYGNEGDKIIDTHMGSQSSRIAAYDMGFDYWGWETDIEYFNDGNKRFDLERSKLKLFNHKS